MLAMGLICDEAEDVDPRAIEARLRDVEITDQPLPHHTPQAIAWIEPQHAESCSEQSVEGWLQCDHHVLVIGTPQWEPEAWDRLSDSARRRGQQLVVVNPDRYLASRQLIKQQLASTSGAPPLGTAGLVRIHTWQPGPNLSTEPARECRTLPMTLVRELDLVLWLTGEQPSVVYATESNWDDAGGRQGRSVQVHLGFDVAMALLDCEVSAAVGVGYRSLSVIGSSGAAYVDDQRNAQLLFHGWAPQAICAAESRERQLAAIVQEFADAIAAGRDLAAATLDWSDVFAVADAVRRSIATHQAVKLDRPPSGKGS